MLARQFLESTMSFCKFDNAPPPSPLQCYLHCPVFAIKLFHLIESLTLCSQVLLTHFCLDCSYSKWMHPWLLPDFWKPPKCWFSLWFYYKRNDYIWLTTPCGQGWIKFIYAWPTLWWSKLFKRYPTWVYLCKSMIHCNNHCWVEHISKYATNQFVNKIKISIQLWRYNIDPNCQINPPSVHRCMCQISCQS